MARCPTQAVLPLVGLAVEKVIRDRYNKGWERCFFTIAKCFGWPPWRFFSPPGVWLRRRASVRKKRRR
ncbi:MAG: hypothetical protein ACQESR_13705 [Planctomycetota bacterium]